MLQQLQPSVIVAPTLWRRRMKALAWKCLSLPCLGLIYWVVNSQGIRTQMPIFALRLYKVPLPGLGLLQYFEALCQLDLANIFAMFLLFGVWYLSVAVLRALLYDWTPGSKALANPRLYRRLIFVLAPIVIGGDMLVFYGGLANRVDTVWGEPSPFVPAVATVVYMGLLVFVSLIHVTFEENC
jgi:hypothetical protein